MEHPAAGASQKIAVAIHFMDFSIKTMCICLVALENIFFLLLYL